MSGDERLPPLAYAPMHRPDCGKKLFYKLITEKKF